MQPEGGVYKSHTNRMDVLQLLYFVVCEQIKGELDYVWQYWHEQRFCAAGAVPRNSTGGLADGNSWVSMQSSRNGFTMPTHVTNLVFGNSTTYLWRVVGKTGRGAGVGVGDQWENQEIGNWKIK